MPDARKVTRRLMLWEFPLVVFGAAIYFGPSSLWIVVACIMACVLAGIFQTLRVTAHIIIASRVGS